MDYKQLLINIITKNTTHGLSEAEEDACFHLLLRTLTEDEKHSIINRLKEK